MPAVSKPAASSNRQAQNARQIGTSRTLAGPMQKAPAKAGAFYLNLVVDELPCLN